MKVYKVLLFFIVLLLPACGQFNVSIDPLQTSMPTNTVEIPTSTSTAAASPTVQASSTATVTIPSPTLVLPTATQA